MMPDRFDELAKRKQLEDLDLNQVNSQIGQGSTAGDLTPRPIQEISTYNDKIEGEPLVGDPISTTAPQEQAQARQPAWYQNKAIADAIVGATPTLLSFLGGASASHINRQADAGNAYVKNRATQEIPTKANTFTEDVDGQPQISMMSDSLGKRPYQKPAIVRAGGLSGSARDYVPYDSYDPSTGQRDVLVFNGRKNEYYDIQGNLVKPNKGTILKPATNKLIKNKDIQGTVIDKAYNQYDKKPLETISTTEGLGLHYNVATEGQGKTIEKGYDDAQKESQAITGSLAEADSALKTMRTTKDPRVLSAAIYAMARSVEPKGQFTDQDFENIAGDKYNSWYKNLDYILQTKGAGEIEALRDSYIALGEKIQAKLRAKEATIASRFAPGSKKAQEGLKNVVPLSTGNKTKKAEYLEIERRAKLKIKDPVIRQKFLNKKKNELGLDNV